jgi:hypothetical protein
MNAFPKPKLERSTCLFWVLSPEEQERWKATTSEGRKAIEKEHRRGMDKMEEQGPATAEQVAEAWAQARFWTEQLQAGKVEAWTEQLQSGAAEKAGAEKAGPVPYYECDDDDDMDYLE